MKVAEQIAALEKKISELQAEIDKLKAGSKEVHNHFHTHYHPSVVPYVQPTYIPPYTITCGNQNVLDDGHSVTCGNFSYGAQ